MSSVNSSSCAACLSTSFAWVSGKINPFVGKLPAPVQESVSYLGRQWTPECSGALAVISLIYSLSCFYECRKPLRENQLGALDKKDYRQEFANWHPRVFALVKQQEQATAELNGALLAQYGLGESGFQRAASLGASPSRGGTEVAELEGHVAAVAEAAASLPLPATASVEPRANAMPLISDDPLALKQQVRILQQRLAAIEKSARIKDLVHASLGRKAELAVEEATLLAHGKELEQGLFSFQTQSLHLERAANRRFSLRNRGEISLAVAAFFAAMAYSGNHA